MPGIVGDGWDPPAAVRDRCEFHWFHVSPGSVLVIVVLSAAPSWYVGHFDAGRMRRCEGPVCALCAKGVGRQLRYVFSCVEISTHQNGVVEVSKSVAELLREWAARKCGFRGMVLQLEKATKSKHSRMEVKYIDRDAPVWASEVEAVDVLEALEATWERMSG
jgi:hypothetical protein